MPLSPFLNNILNKQQALFSKSSIDWKKDLELLDNLPINNWQEYKKYFYLKQHLPTIIKNLIDRIPNSNEIKSVIFYILQNDLSTDEVIKLYQNTEDALKHLQLFHNKKAYPEGINNSVDSSYSVEKWILAAKTLKDHLILGKPYSEAWQLITSSWPRTEVLDFFQWLKFYQNMDHLKYKTAQSFLYEQVPEPTLISRLPEPINSEKPSLTKKETIEKTIKSILGRLNSAEKLATMPIIRDTLHRMLGDLDGWLSNLHTLKRKLQSAPWVVIAAYRSLPINELDKVASQTLLSDLIYCESNKSNDETCKRLLQKVAQAIEPIPTINDVEETGVEPEETEEGSDEIINQIISRMNPGSSKCDDKAFIVDMVDDPKSRITSLAQSLPLRTPQAQLIKQIPNNIEAEDPIENALSKVTIKEIVDRLESVASIFRKREVPRQLAIIDLMLDKLNIATYFPTLAEASQKSLDSNQYALTRIEDILSKLRGALLIPDNQRVELKPGVNLTPPSGIQNILNQDAQKRQTEDILQQKSDLTAPVQQPEGNQPITPISNIQQGLAGPIPQIKAPESRPVTPTALIR